MSPFDRAHNDFLLTFHSNYGSISYRFWDKRRFQSKIAKFSHPLLFCVPTEGVSLGIGYRAGGQKTRMMWLPGRQRSLTISSAVWIKCIECTNVTDGQTDAGPQQRPRLRIAWRGKNRSLPKIHNTDGIEKHWRRLRGTGASTLNSLLTRRALLWAHIPITIPTRWSLGARVRIWETAVNS